MHQIDLGRSAAQSLFLAVKNGVLAAVKSYIKSGGNPNPELDGVSLISHAGHNRRWNIVAYLKKKGVTYNLDIPKSKDRMDPKEIPSGREGRRKGRKKKATRSFRH